MTRNRSMHDKFKHELQSEQQYETKAWTETVYINVSQKIAYDILIDAKNSGSGRIHLIDGL